MLCVSGTVSRSDSSNSISLASLSRPSRRLNCINIKLYSRGNAGPAGKIPSPGGLQSVVLAFFYCVCVCVCVCVYGCMGVLCISLCRIADANECVMEGRRHADGSNVRGIL